MVIIRQERKREKGDLVRGVVHLCLPHGAGSPLLDLIALGLLLSDTASKKLVVLSL